MKSILFAAALAGGVTVQLPQAADASFADADRIVTLGGSVTETVFALGAGDRVVATDLSSTHPPAANALPKVGYHRALSSEGVLSLRPDLILGTEDAGPPTALQQLRSAHAGVVLVPSDPSVEGTRRKIGAIAKTLELEEEGRALIDSLDRDLEAARAHVRAAGTSPRVLFIYARGQGALSVAGRNTAADAVIALAGGANAVTGYEGYKPLTPEALAAAAPDVLLLTTTGLASASGKAGLRKQPGILLTPAGESGNILALDDELLLGFGPRLGRGVLELSRLLLPEVSLPAAE